MILFSAISYFSTRLSTLKAVRKGVYASVEEEVRRAFQGLDIDQIRQNYDMILLDGPHIIIKLRLPDRKHHLSKRDGYRLIYLVYKDREEVGFLDIYPKNGPAQQLDIDEAQVVELVGQYVEEKEKNLLQKFDI